MHSYNFTKQLLHMYTSDDYKSLKKRMLELYDNATTAAVNRSGRSQPTVTKFFNEITIRQSSWLSIYEACLELVEEKEALLDKLYKKSNKLMNKNESTNIEEQ